MMINKKEITFSTPLNINGKTIESYTNDTRIICNERCERYFIERAFEANGFSRVRLDGKEAKLEDQMNKEYEDFLYAPGAPSLGFYPKNKEIENNAQIIYGLGTVAVLEFINDCNAWPSVEFYKELNAKMMQDRKIRLEANTKKNEMMPAAEPAKEEKPKAESTTSTAETVAVTKEPKAESTTSTAETVAVAEQPKTAKAEKQQKPKEDKVAKNAAPWTRPMTSIDGTTGKPAPEENAPQATQQVGINVIPNAKPVEQQPKSEKPKVDEPQYDETQDLKAILPENKLWQAVLKAAEVKVRLNVIPTPNSGILTVLAFGKGSKKYMPDKSFYLDFGCIIDGSAKVIPIVPQDKVIEDKDFMVITESDTSNLEKFLTNGRMPGKKTEEQQALLQELRKANHYVELATLEQRASLIEFARLINTDKVVQDHVKKYGARFRVAACDKKLGVVTLLMDQTCTDSVLGKPCGPVQPYQAVLIQGQPTQINCVAVAA